MFYLHPNINDTKVNTIQVVQIHEDSAIKHIIKTISVSIDPSYLINVIIAIIAMICMTAKKYVLITNSFKLNLLINS